MMVLSAQYFKIPSQSCACWTLRPPWLFQLSCVDLPSKVVHIKVFGLWGIASQVGRLDSTSPDNSCWETAGWIFLGSRSWRSKSHRAKVRMNSISRRRCLAHSPSVSGRPQLCSMTARATCSAPEGERACCGASSLAGPVACHSDRAYSPLATCPPSLQPLGG
jgi:hypothetical protein